MKRVVKLLIVIAFFAGLSFPMIMFAASASKIATMEAKVAGFVKEERLYNVVKLRGAGGRGYGLIIGRREDKLLVVTARHLLHDDFVNGLPGANAILTVRFYGNEETWLGVAGGTYEPASERVRDVAVIQVVVPSGPDGSGRPYMKADRWREDIVVQDAEVNTRVEFAGTVDDIGYAGGGGRITRVVEGNAVEFDGLVGEEGQSGVPVASDRGFLGLYLGVGNPDFVSLMDVKNAVEELGPSLWQLLAVPEKTKVMVLCVRLQGAELSDVRISGPYGLLELDEGGCGRTGSGKHNVFGKPSGLLCEPSKFLAVPDATGPFVLRCTVDPSGSWQGPGQGFLTLERLSETVWLMTLSLPNNRGVVRGRVTAPYSQASQLFLGDARLHTGVPVYGSFKLEHGKLLMDVLVGMREVKGEFWR